MAALGDQQRDDDVRALHAAAQVVLHCNMPVGWHCPVHSLLMLLYVIFRVLDYCLVSILMKIIAATCLVCPHQVCPAAVIDGSACVYIISCLFAVVRAVFPMKLQQFMDRIRTGMVLQILLARSVCVCAF